VGICPCRCPCLLSSRRDLRLPLAVVLACFLSPPANVISTASSHCLLVRRMGGEICCCCWRCFCPCRLPCLLSSRRDLRLPFAVVLVRFLSPRAFVLTKPSAG